MIIAQSKTEQSGKPGIPEYLICSVQQGGSASVLVAVIYRPPHVPFIQGTDLVEQLRSCSNDFSHKIIMGDLNANLLSSSADVKFVRNLTNELALKIVDHGATHHHTNGSHTLIDVIFVDDNDEVLSSGNRMATFPSRHTIIDVTIKIHSFVTTNLATFTYRDFKSIDSAHLISVL